MNELQKVMIKKLALNLAYHYVAPAITKMVLSDAIERHELEPSKAFIMQDDATEYALSQLETGKLSVYNFMDKEIWDFILDSTITKVKDYFEENPEGAHEMFNDYIDYMNDKYPAMS